MNNVDTPILSVSVAAYNVEKYLQKCVSSCCNAEKEGRIEVIIVDDGSSDSTLRIAEELKELYPQIVKVIHKENGGYGSTINAALECASGTYFKLLDGDDWFDASELTSFLTELEKRSEDIILLDYCMKYMDGEKEIKSIRKCIEGFDAGCSYPIDRLKDLYVSMHASAVRTDMLRRSRMMILEHCFYTDHQFIFKALIHGQTVCYLPLCVYQYRLGTDGQSVSLSGILKHLGDNWKVMREELSYVNENDINSEKKEILNSYMAILGKDVISYYLLGKCYKEKIMSIEAEIQRINPEVYEKMGRISRPIKTMRILGYRIYPLLYVNERRKYR